MPTPEQAAGTPAAGGARFELRYRLDSNDFTLARRSIPDTPIDRLSRSLIAIGLITIGVLLGALVWFALQAQLASVFPKSGLGLSISIVTTALLYLYYYVLWPARYRSACQDLPEVMGESHLVANEAGLTHTVLDIEVFAPWKVISQIEETQTHFVLVVTRATGFVIPKRGFGDAAQATRFLAFARAHKA